MTIAESFKAAINNAFKYVVFPDRDEETILRTLNTKIHGTYRSLIPPISTFKVEHLNDTHDKATFIFDDYTFEGVITWRQSKNSEKFVFLGIE